MVQNGGIRLPASVDVPDGTPVRALVDDDALATRGQEHAPIEPEPLNEVEVLADVRWATGQRFS